MEVAAFGTLLGWILSLAYLIRSRNGTTANAKWTLDQSLALAAIVVPFLTFAVILVFAFVEFVNTTRWN